VHHGPGLLCQVQVVLNERVLGAPPAARHAFAHLAASPAGRPGAAEEWIRDQYAGLLAAIPAEVHSDAGGAERGPGAHLLGHRLDDEGYWANEAATKEMIDADGWLHTGDLGALDQEDFLTITGRKKDLIITAAGKNVAPEVLEDRLRSHWMVGECLVVGDAKPYIAALIAEDPETFAQWRAEHGKPETATMADLGDDPALRAEIQGAVDYANRAVSQAEAIKKFAIVSGEFTETGGQLRPTLKSAPRRSHQAVRGADCRAV
jgi:hypothetical protein